MVGLVQLFVEPFDLVIPTFQQVFQKFCRTVEIMFAARKAVHDGLGKPVSTVLFLVVGLVLALVFVLVRHGPAKLMIHW